MAVLTVTQVLLVGALGGLATLIGLALSVAAGLAAYTAATRIERAVADRRARRDDLKTCRAIYQLDPDNPDPDPDQH